MLDSSKQSSESIAAEYEDNNESQCDQRSYKCENKDMLITHVNKEYDKSYACTLCAEFFGTTNLLSVQNKYFHNIKNFSSESEFDQVAQKGDNEINQHKNVKKSKKKNSRK